MYTDCGKCPYMGGCTNCDHPARHKAARAVDKIMADLAEHEMGWEDQDEDELKALRLRWIDIIEQTP